MPVIGADGKEVLKLVFQSSKRSSHLCASLTFPDGTALAELNMGTPPSGGLGGMAASIGGEYSMGPPPPVKLHVLGQAYGTYTATSYMNLLLQSGARWNRADGTRSATIHVEPAQNVCCFCIPDADQRIPRKKSTLGKQEIRMSVTNGAHGSTALHLVTDTR